MPTDLGGLMLPPTTKLKSLQGDRRGYWTRGDTGWTFTEAGPNRGVPAISAGGTASRASNAVPVAMGSAPPIAPKVTMPSRSNKGGALRGEARAAQVKAMNTARKAAQNTPDAMRRQARLRRRQALSFRSSFRG